jgi:ankyrin repeat protein
MAGPTGIDLDQYRAQAKELLKRARGADRDACERIRQHHPEHEALLASSRLQLADSQLVIARENGFASWPRFRDHLLVRAGVAAIDQGDLPRLTALLDRSPRVLGLRCRVGEWYEEGYFRGAMLLHHVAGNPIRCPLPDNILPVTRLLLDRGADPNAATGGGATTIGLLLTSRQASEAGVALPLVDLLRAAGARCDEDDASILSAPLLNAAPATARELVRRGAKMDLRHAAGLGRLDVLEPLLASGAKPAMREEALAFACIRGETAAARMLVAHGARGDLLVAPGGRTPRTALHEAANRGHRDIVQLLLEHGADPGVVEPHFGGTPAGWAEHGGHAELAAVLRERRPA